MQVERFKEVPTHEELKLGFQHRFEAIVQHQKRLLVHTRSSGDPSGAQVYKIYIV